MQHVCQVAGNEDDSYEKLFAEISANYGPNKVVAMRLDTGMGIRAERCYLKDSSILQKCNRWGHLEMPHFLRSLNGDRGEGIHSGCRGCVQPSNIHDAGIAGLQAAVIGHCQPEDQ